MQVEVYQNILKLTCWALAFTLRSLELVFFSQFLVCDVINFEISHSVLIKPFFHINKKSGQKQLDLKNEKTFNMK